MQNVAKFRLIEVFSTSAQYVQIVANMSTFCISAQYVRMSLNEPLMNKSCPKWLFWVYLDANKCFQSKSRPNSWEMTPGYPTLWIWCRKIVETSKTCKKVAVFRLILDFQVPLPNIRAKSGKYVHFFYLGPIRTNESQRALNVQK